MLPGCPDFNNLCNGFIANLRHDKIHHSDCGLKPAALFGDVANSLHLFSAF